MDNTSRRYRVLIVDDRVMPRIAAKAMLANVADMVLVAEAASGAEAADLVTKEKFDIVLMDVDMPDVDGPDAARALLELDPALTILAWTVSDSSEDLLRMIQAGCAGYVLKDVGPEELQRAIRAAMRHEAPVPRRMLPEILRSAAHQVLVPKSGSISLTDREHEVLRLIAKGFPSKRMAIELGISRASVDTHLRNVFRKLGANNRGEAVSRALREGLLSVADL